jgi:hypothetical protein
MAGILLSYFGTMVTALAALMFVLNAALSSSMLHHARQQPYPMPVIAEAAAPDYEDGVAAKRPEMAQAQASRSDSSFGSVAANPQGPRAATKQALAQKSRNIKVARDQRRQQRLATAQRPDQNYTMALGYAEERPQQLAAEKIFNGPLHRF